MEVYFDNSATTRVLDEVKDLTVKLMTEDYGNPSARHRKGMEAEQYVKNAASQIAKTLKVKEKEILFTSGGTESNNMALIGTALANQRAGKHIISTRIEHASVYQPLAFLESLGFEVTYLSVDSEGHISLEELDSLLTATEKDTHAEGPGLGLGKKYLCITMDDGYFSNYDLAYPLFKKYRVPASVFAVTDYVTNRIGIQKFTWNQAATMEKSGYMKVYSHTADHQPVVAGEEEAFLDSMRRSEETLTENLGTKHVKAMAYPNGRYTEAAQQLLDEDGYVLQFTVENSVITRKTKRDAIPRITIESGMSGEDVVRKIELTAENTFAAEGEGNET